VWHPRRCTFFRRAEEDTIRIARWTRNAYTLHQAALQEKEDDEYCSSAKENFAIGIASTIDVDPCANSQNDRTHGRNSEGHSVRNEPCKHPQGWRRWHITGDVTGRNGGNRLFEQAWDYSWMNKREQNIHDRKEEEFGIKAQSTFITDLISFSSIMGLSQRDWRGCSLQTTSHWRDYRSWHLCFATRVRNQTRTL